MDAETCEVGTALFVTTVFDVGARTMHGGTSLAWCSCRAPEVQSLRSSLAPRHSHVQFVIRVPARWRVQGACRAPEVQSLASDTTESRGVGVVPGAIAAQGQPVVPRCDAHKRPPPNNLNSTNGVRELYGCVARRERGAQCVHFGARHEHHSEATRPQARPAREPRRSRGVFGTTTPPPPPRPTAPAPTNGSTPARFFAAARAGPCDRQTSACRRRLGRCLR